MTAASANKVTVPGDNRLDELKLGNKTPFWHKIPIIKGTTRRSRLAEKAC